MKWNNSNNNNNNSGERTSVFYTNTQFTSNANGLTTSKVRKFTNLILYL